ncbi:MAG: sigma-70 family RNA polymerase sigma factor [Clostridia bacterium]|nr:sigma-70 family RNA polymerase sigma factor [Clostridia bacterium]
MRAALQEAKNDGLGARDAVPVVEGFVKRYYADIFRYCQWHTPDRASAEDAAQETFLKFIRFSDRFDDRGKTKAFLYRIAQNTCTDLMRKRRMEALPGDAAYEEKGYLHAKMSVDAQALLRVLNEGQRELILLRFAQDLSFREIAGITGIPMRTVQTRIRKALGLMKATQRRS